MTHNPPERRVQRHETDSKNSGICRMESILTMIPKSSKILLIVPYHSENYMGFSDITVGTGYINAALRNHGYDPICLAFIGEKDPEELLKKTIIENKIGIVLCGGLTFQYHYIRGVNDIVKAIDPEIITIGGGGGFTAEPILFSEMCRADYAIIGEGDFSVCELLDAIFNGGDISKIKGVVYKDEGGKYCFTGHREPIADLDSIPFPSYEGFPIEQMLQLATPLSGFNTYYTDKPRIMSICYSRSCPFKCSFCFHPTGDKYRTRSMDNFFLELDTYVEKYRINGIAIVDECFRMDDSVFEFCERIKKYNLRFVVSLVAKTVTYEKLLALKNAGCCAVSYGIESMSETVLSDMHKPANVRVIERALRLTVKAGISVQGNLIFGAEAETADTLRETLSWWLTHREYQLALNLVTPYPGSLYYAHCVQRGIIPDRKKYIEMGCPWVNMSKLSDHDYDRLMTLISLPSDAKIAWDFACQSEIVETIPNYEGNEDLVSMRLKCYHCGRVHTYGNLPKKEVSKAFYMPCRSCGMLSTYGKTPSFNYQVMTQWMKNEARGEKLIDWLTSHGINRLVIFGMGDLGVTLYSYLEPYNLVVGVANRTKRAETYVFDHTHAELLLAEEIAPLSPDLVIIAPSYGKQETISYLRKKGYSGRVETLFDIVFGISDILTPPSNNKEENLIE